MKKLYSIAFLFSFVVVNIHAVANTLAFKAGSFGIADTSKKAKTSLKISDTRKKAEYPQKVFNVEIVPFQPAHAKTIQSTANTPVSNTTSPAKVSTQPDIKAVSNVKVYPNPVAEQLNLTYNVGKDSNVTIKIMDILGNEITTLLSQKMQAGEQTNTFNINNKLNSGFYFVRLIVGSETVIKRISIL